MSDIKRKTRTQEQGPVVLENKRPSDNYIKRGSPPHVIKRVTQKEIMDLQNPAKLNPDFLGFKPHKVNGIIPVVPETNMIIPAEDGTVGIALMKPQKKEGLKDEK